MEVWKQIPGCDEYYISSYGNVKFRSTYITLYETEYGIIKFHVKSNGKYTTRTLSTIVAESFVANPNGYKFVTHIDGDRKNCSATNLRWVDKAPKRQRSIGDVANTDTELWEVIPQTDGLYKISSLGRVFSLKSNRLLKPYVNSTGYYTFTICVNNKKRLGTIHRLVAEIFVPNPYNKEQVDHIDGDKLNNTYTNLRWATPKENCNNPNTVTKLSKTGMLTAKPVAKMLNGTCVGIYPSIRSVSSDGYSACAVKRCCDGVSNSHKGFKWVYLHI